MFGSFQHFAEEPFGGLRISFRAQHEIDSLSRRIDGFATQPEKSLKIEKPVGEAKLTGFFYCHMAYEAVTGEERFGFSSLVTAFLSIGHCPTG